MTAPLSMRKELIMEEQALPIASSLASDAVKAKLTNSIQADQDFIRRGHEKLRQEKLAEAKAKLAASKAATSQAVPKLAMPRHSSLAQVISQSTYVNTSGKKRTVETSDSSSQRKRKAKQTICRSCHESDGERTPTDEDVENEVATEAMTRREARARIAQMVVQINPPQPKGTEIHTVVPTSFRESTTPIVKDQAQQYESLSLVPLSTIETNRAIQTILAVPSHGQARETIVDLSTPDTPSPHDIHFEPEVQAIEASNVEPIEMNFASESLSKEKELQAREAIYLLSTNPESSINQILDYARESLDLIPSIRDLLSNIKKS
ncbi:hypothetical protein M0R45_006376 [Rubus argutus]|uniref:Uncharacterized protein n=1 Tax=Rubus argutus TaxID=59490 RepID=A0AAW1YQ81_RUBAR